MICASPISTMGKLATAVSHSLRSTTIAVLEHSRSGALAPNRAPVPSMSRSNSALSGACRLASSVANSRDNVQRGGGVSRTSALQALAAIEPVNARPPTKTVLRSEASRPLENTEEQNPSRWSMRRESTRPFDRMSNFELQTGRRFKSGCRLAMLMMAFSSRRDGNLLFTRVLSHPPAV